MVLKVFDLDVVEVVVETLEVVEGAVAGTTDAVVYEGLVTMNGCGLLKGNLAGNSGLFVLDVDVTVVVVVLAVVLRTFSSSKFLSA